VKKGERKAVGRRAENDEVLTERRVVAISVSAPCFRRRGLADEALTESAFACAHNLAGVQKKASLLTVRFVKLSGCPRNGVQMLPTF
jgi:hypothetical protein